MPHPAQISRRPANRLIPPQALPRSPFGSHAQGVFHPRGQPSDRLPALAVHRHLHPGCRRVVVRAGFHGVELGAVDRLATDLDHRGFCYRFAFWGEISRRSPPTY